MLTRVTTLAVFLCLSFAATASSSPTPSEAGKLYLGSLHSKCPDKHLEMLSPASLSDLDDAFLPRFSPAQRRSVQASIRQSCKGIDMGATCSNVGFLQATIRLHKLDAFTTHVCATKQRCTDYSTCTDVQ